MVTPNIGVFQSASALASGRCRFALAS